MNIKIDKKKSKKQLNSNHKMSDTTNPTNLNIITPVPEPEDLVELLVDDSLSEESSDPMCPVCFDELERDILVLLIHS